MEKSDVQKTQAGDQEVWKAVLDKTEVVAVVTGDGQSPHLVATWGDYVRAFGIVNGEILLVPVGSYHQTEMNLKRNKSLQLLVASKQVQGRHGPGQGCIIEGEGEIQAQGPFAEKVKAKFPWARGALVIKVKKAAPQL